MKLCVCDIPINSSPLYESNGFLLYRLPVTDYKRYILKGVIKYEHAYYISLLSYKYALNVLKGRFEIGEEAISGFLAHSMSYASEVLKGRFVLGENIISTNASDSIWYARHIVRGRFEQGENAIKKDARLCVHYAVSVLGTRFIEGERIIKGSRYQQEYERQFNIRL